MDNKDWVIAWQSKRSRASGFEGEPISREDADVMCVELNKIHADEAYYYPAKVNSIKKDDDYDYDARKTWDAPKKKSTPKVKPKKMTLAEAIAIFSQF